MLTVAYAGGTAFNVPRLAENFARYRDTQRKMTEVAGAAGATVLMTNHTECDRAYDRARLAQLPRAVGEKHPYETDTATVLRYFEMSAACAEAVNAVTPLARQRVAPQVEEACASRILTRGSGPAPELTRS
jgi:metallo-beta-lactamase class B